MVRLPRLRARCVPETSGVSGARLIPRTLSQPPCQMPQLSGRCGNHVVASRASPGADCADGGRGSRPVRRAGHILQLSRVFGHPGMGEGWPFARPGLPEAAPAVRGSAVSSRDPLAGAPERAHPRRSRRMIRARAGPAPSRPRHRRSDAEGIIVCIITISDEETGNDCPMCTRQESAAAGVRAAATVALSLTQPKMPPWAVIMRRATAWNSGK